ncbi:NADPH-dependent F420 reductase [Devosia sp.]|uniref:NADPH-dependent F420 reductase n=1 Tax=Devosia sp. TaxID=1871048 RepID=UPI002F1C7B46
MSIAILGTGNMAKGLAGVFDAAGYDVVIGSRDPLRAAETARTIGPRVAGTGLAEAAAGADTIVLAVPFDGVADVLAAAGDLSGKVVIDITNPLTADYAGLTIGHSTSAAEEIARLVPGARVVKAFNTVFAGVLQAGGKLGGQPVTVFVAGDDETANAAVEAIAARAGFAVQQAGALARARYLEPVAGLNIALGYFQGLGTDIAPTWQKAA